MEDYTNKRILYVGLTVIALFLFTSIIVINAKNKKSVEEYDFPSPEEVVSQYFTAWSNKDYPNMYSAISDGFKRIEPTATTFQDFKNYVNSQGIESIEITKIEETGNNGETAAVSYNVIFLLTSGQKTNYDGTFTLKYRKGDVIQGWKLIHPYGDKIDTS